MHRPDTTYMKMDNAGTKMATSSEKLENCEVCAANKAKYTCPKCEVRTCSLTCVNIHKKELQCDGIRDKTKFVHLNAFTDLDLLSDYRLLEQVGRSVDQLQRDPSKHCTRMNNLPVHLSKLRSAAHHAGVRLEYMPQNFSRHKENTTIFMWKTNELFWRIEWIFPQAENTKWISKRVPDTIRLADLVQGILNPTSSKEECAKDEDENTRAILQERLQFYRAAELTGIKVLLKAEKVKKSVSRFYELDLTMTMRENFSKKTIIEFPTLYVILKDHSDMYETIDSDEEEILEEQPVRNGDRRRRKGKQPNVPQKPKPEAKTDPVNFFFDAEFTDSDDESAKSKRNVSKAGSSSQFNIPEYNELVRMEY